jgi:hypothetical protein
MIIKNEKNARLEVCFDNTTIPIRCGLAIDEYTHGSRQIENPNIHYTLHNDLIENLWVPKGNNEVQ